MSTCFCRLYNAKRFSDSRRDSCDQQAETADHKPNLSQHPVRNNSSATQAHSYTPAHRKDSQ